MDFMTAGGANSDGALMTSGIEALKMCISLIEEVGLVELAESKAINKHRSSWAVAVSAPTSQSALNSLEQAVSFMHLSRQFKASLKAWCCCLSNRSGDRHQQFVGAGSLCSGARGLLATARAP